MKRIGINPLTWTNDDLPSLGDDIPLEVCLQEAKEAGYEGVELGRKFPRQATALRPLLDAHSLKLISGWYSGRLLERSVEEEARQMDRHIRLLTEMECEVVVFAEVTGCVHGDRSVPVSRRPVLHPKAVKKLGESLTLLSEYLESRGLKLAYHHHMGTVIQTEREIEHLMAASGQDVGLLLDTGHLTYAKGDLQRVLSRHADRIVHVHLKDVRAAVLERALRYDSSFLDAVVDGIFTVPGDGCVDYPKVLRALDKAQYDGWLVVEAEQDPKKAHPLTYAKMGFENTARWLAEIGE